MSIKQRIVVEPSPRHEELRRLLVEEWRNPRVGDEEPIIIAEGGGAFRPIHIYVIWNDWVNLTLQERSEIIMDAFEELRGRDEVLNVTVAMGLTPAEAKRMKIKYA